MTVKDLANILSELPADMVIVLQGADHSYRPVWRAYETVAEYTDGMYFEHYNDFPILPPDQKRRVLVVE